MARGTSTMGRTKLPYLPEFRDEAVHLVREGGKSIGQVAKDPGIADQSLRNWVKQSDLDAGRRTDGLTTIETICFGACTHGRKISNLPRWQPASVQLRSRHGAGVRDRQV
jgi:transposase-like protein